MYFNSHRAAPVNGHASLLPMVAQSAIGDDNADRRQWDNCMAEYLRTRALVLAVMDYGPMAEADEARDQIQRCLAAQFGKDFPHQPEAGQVWREAKERWDEADREATERYLRPMWAAQQALVMCPAPDLAAALFKSEMVQIDSMGEDIALKGQAFAYVAADLERFAP